MADAGSHIHTLVEQIRATGQYEVLALLQRHERYADDDHSEKRVAAFVDVETTGRDAASDAIIELALVPFEYCPHTGKVFRVDDAVCYLEDPRRPIPAEVSALTGITDDMVAGKQIDEARVYELLERASLVIAHNAAFDRPFLERRLARFKDKPWACSMKCVPWQSYGINSRSLEYLLYKHGRVFTQAHRAAQDCYSGVHILATPFADGTLPMAQLLASARGRTARIWAIGSRFDIKDVLKARGYRWSDGSNGWPRSWYIEVPEASVEEEHAWLTAEIFGGNGSSIETEMLDARTRYSDRHLLRT